MHTLPLEATTDGFTPSRLTVARQRRALTKKDLAGWAGLSSRAILGFEDGTISPSKQTVHQLAFALRFPPEFFSGNELELIDVNKPSFRARRAMTGELRRRALASGVIATQVISPQIARYCRLPAVNVPDLSDELPETAAAILREHWKLGQGPIGNMVHLLESRGVHVYWLAEESRCLDAFSLWRDEKPFVLLNANKQAGDRGRFDAAHELAHLVLHRRAEVIDGREIEAEADRFASAFLMPESQFRTESPRFPLYEVYFKLKERWGVSIQALVRRSKDLNLLTPWQYECACRDIAMRGWRTEEPVKIPREESKSHAQVMQILARKGLSLDVFARNTRLHKEDLCELMPLASRQQELVVELPVESFNAQTPQNEERRLQHLRLVG